ncbi:MAG: ABC transporter ATP-binding protein [Cyclobacteriaceae bacterium]|nr:ABC transporter ATP-binding protein [Cyclobacteriaceae bacterium]MCH8516882.1 ABC transporter ATP-binding protein [Cyclobacteriaceae bacterium]
MKHQLTIKGLQIGYQKRQPILSIEHAILNSGELTLLLGSNGVGKSTLIHTLGGLHAALSGSVMLNGENIFEYNAQTKAEKIALVLSSIPENPFKVKDLVALGRTPHSTWTGKLSKEDREIVEKTMYDIGLIELKDRFFSDLSDGQKQKVLIARSLAQESSILLLDEPGSHLDIRNKIELFEILLQLAKDKIVIMSSHDVSLACELAHHIWLIDQNKSFIAGMPEELIFADVFERNFASKKITFDKLSATFKTNNPELQTIYNQLEGLSEVYRLRTAYALSKRFPYKDIPKIYCGENYWKINDEKFQSLPHLVTAINAKIG